MALIRCPECKKPVSVQAKSCPHCGCPQKVWLEPMYEEFKKTPEYARQKHQREKKEMKRGVIIIIICLVFLSLISISSLLSEGYSFTGEPGKGSYQHTRAEHKVELDYDDCIKNPLKHTDELAYADVLFLEDHGEDDYSKACLISDESKVLYVRWFSSSTGDNVKKGDKWRIFGYFDGVKRIKKAGVNGKEFVFVAGLYNDLDPSPVVPSAEATEGKTDDNPPAKEDCSTELDYDELVNDPESHADELGYVDIIMPSFYARYGECSLRGYIIGDETKTIFLETHDLPFGYDGARFRVYGRFKGIKEMKKGSFFKETTTEPSPETEENPVLRAYYFDVLTAQ